MVLFYVGKDRRKARASSTRLSSMETASAVPSWPSKIIVGRNKKVEVLTRMGFDRSFDSNGSSSAARMEGLYVTKDRSSS